jgi:hypothetical protein
MAMVHAAMFDAVNAIDQRYTAYRVKGAASGGASPDAAVATAAHAVLAKLFPEQGASLDKAYADALARIPDEASKTAGVNQGRKVANEIIQWRTGDGIGGPNTYRPRTTPGVYAATPLPIGFDVAHSKPWLMDRADQFRPDPPPTLASEDWARAYNEVREIGGKASTRRTPEQTSIAQFWIVTGAPSWNAIVRQCAAAKGMNTVKSARLFALVYLAAADSVVAVFEAKYAYNFWRPITAIRNGDTDDNPGTMLAAAWLPLIDTPLHPEYPCAHCINAAAVGTVLEAEFGSGSIGPFSMTSQFLPGSTRSWARIGDYIEEVSNARVWGGIHYRFSTEVGNEMGRKIGKLAVDNFLRPIQ